MNNIDSFIPFDEKSLDIQNYTASLISNCLVCKIIDETKVQYFNKCITDNFIEIAEELTYRESSTIPKKKAELIVSSILYQSDVYLLNQPSIAVAIFELNNTDFNDIIKLGKKLILQIHQNNLDVFKIAFKNKLNINHFEYQYVMYKSFDKYAKNYSPRFDARNCCATIDYPLLGQPAYNIKLEGVMFISKYYTSLMYENIFCKFFKEEDIINILKRYGRIYSCNYCDLQINISEIVFNNIIITTFIGKKLFDLVLNKNDIQELIERYTYFPIEKIKCDLNNAYHKYKEVFKNDGLYKYFYKYIENLSIEIQTRICNSNLDKLFVIY